jgi:hypothetical protein
MAALCSRRGAPETACSHRDHHVRRVAGVVATEKARIEGNIYTVRKPDYTAEEWRLLYLTTSVDLYLHSIRLVGFCGFGDIKWAMVTRMKEENNLPRERYYEIFSKESYPVLHYMRPQFRFLVFFGRINPRINLAHNEDRFFYDMKKVVNGDVSVWGEPVVVDGVPLVPEVECLVPSWLQQEYFARTAHLGLPAGQHYVYPGVRSPLLLPTDYIRKYIFFFPYVDSFFSYNWYAVVLRLAFCLTAVVPMWADQRSVALRMGGHVLCRHFRYYVSDVSGRGTVQIPLAVR